MVVYKKSALLAQLIAMLAEDGLLDGCKLGLIRTNITPNKNNVIADFGVATFNGIAAWTVLTFGAPYVNDDDVVEALAQLVHLVTTSAPEETVTVYGYVISNGDNSDWILAEKFLAPYNFVRNGQALQLVPAVRLDS